MKRKASCFYKAGLKAFKAGRLEPSKPIAGADGAVERTAGPFPKNIVLSVRYDRFRYSSRHAEYVQSILGREHCYSPNWFHKRDCGKECDGRLDKCGLPVRPDEEPSEQTCWKSSYRWHLERVRHGVKAVMLRIREGAYGPGQRIEARMATELGIKVVEIEAVDKFECLRVKPTLENLFTGCILGIGLLLLSLCTGFLPGEACRNTLSGKVLIGTDALIIAGGAVGGFLIYRLVPHKSAGALGALIGCLAGVFIAQDIPGAVSGTVGMLWVLLSFGLISRMLSDIMLQLWAIPLKSAGFDTTRDCRSWLTILAERCTRLVWRGREPPAFRWLIVYFTIVILSALPVGVLGFMCVFFGSWANQLFFFLKQVAFMCGILHADLEVVGCDSVQMNGPYLEYGCYDGGRKLYKNATFARFCQTRILIYLPHSWQWKLAYHPIGMFACIANWFGPSYFTPVDFVNSTALSPPSTGWYDDRSRGPHIHIKRS